MPAAMRLIPLALSTVASHTYTNRNGRTISGDLMESMAMIVFSLFVSILFTAFWVWLIIFITPRWLKETGFKQGVAIFLVCLFAVFTWINSFLGALKGGGILG